MPDIYFYYNNLGMIRLEIQISKTMLSFLHTALWAVTAFWRSKFIKSLGDEGTLFFKKLNLFITKGTDKK